MVSPQLYFNKKSQISPGRGVHEPLTIINKKNLKYVTIGLEM